MVKMLTHHNISYVFLFQDFQLLCMCVRMYIMYIGQTKALQGMSYIRTYISLSTKNQLECIGKAVMMLYLG